MIPGASNPVTRIFGGGTCVCVALYIYKYMICIYKKRVHTYHVYIYTHTYIPYIYIQTNKIIYMWHYVTVFLILICGFGSIMRYIRFYCFYPIVFLVSGFLFALWAIPRMWVSLLGPKPTPCGAPSSSVKDCAVNCCANRSSSDQKSRMSGMPKST